MALGRKAECLPSQLRNLIEIDAAAAIGELRSITSEPGGPGWEDALDLISDPNP